MNDMTLPMFERYFEIASILPPEEYKDFMEKVRQYYFHGQEIEEGSMTQLQRVCFIGIQPGIDRSKQLRLYGQKGGERGKGVTRNLGNQNAAKQKQEIANKSKSIAKQKPNNSQTIAEQKPNNSQTIAEQKPNNSQTIAKQYEVEGEGEVEGEVRRRDDCCRQHTVQSAPVRVKTLGELVTEDEIVRFSLPMLQPDEPEDWFEATIREHFQSVRRTPVKTTWQNLWRIAVNTLRKEGAFVVPRDFDTSSDSFA